MFRTKVGRVEPVSIFRHVGMQIRSFDVAYQRVGVGEARVDLVAVLWFQTVVEELAHDEFEISRIVNPMAIGLLSMTLGRVALTNTRSSLIISLRLKVAFEAAFTSLFGSAIKRRLSRFLTFSHVFSKNALANSLYRPTSKSPDAVLRRNARHSASCRRDSDTVWSMVATRCQCLVASSSLSGLTYPL